MSTIIIPNFNTEKVVTNVYGNSYQYTVQTTALHTCRVVLYRRPSSSMTISIVQAGSVNATIASVLTPTAASDETAQASTILIACANCAANDTLTFTFSDSNVNDSYSNRLKATLNIHIGGLN
jgi:hypothetical protein